MTEGYLVTCIHALQVYKHLYEFVYSAYPYGTKCIPYSIDQPLTVWNEDFDITVISFIIQNLTTFQPEILPVSRTLFNSALTKAADFHSA